MITHVNPLSAPFIAVSTLISAAIALAGLHPMLAAVLPSIAAAWLFMANAGCQNMNMSDFLIGCPWALVAVIWSAPFYVLGGYGGNALRKYLAGHRARKD